MQSGGDIDNYRYSAPEIQWPEDYSMDEVLVTKESDVYGMAMVIYEASSRRSVSRVRVRSHVNIQGLDGERPTLRLQ